MINELLCSLPLPFKIFLGNAKTFSNKNKRKEIKKINTCMDLNYPNLNTVFYKKQLKRFLSACTFSAEETSDYIRFLYNDEVKLIEQGENRKGIPTILCVVKNEADKLVDFFAHYNLIGQFHYIFIDNGSTDGSVEMMIQNHATVYLCTEPFSTNRKLSWINKVYSTIPYGTWTILLDADELMVYEGYENIPFSKVLSDFDQHGIKTSAAVMIDMFSKEPVSTNGYLDKYVYFENRFHEEKSFYFNSVYGGIREREFKFGQERIFLIKKHPLVKKEPGCMLIHCHYIYPFKRNFESKIYFGLLHYKLFNSEIEKYKRIANEGSYGDGSVEYKTYLKAFKNKSYEEIFAGSSETIRYAGTPSLKKISCLLDVGELTK